MSVDDRLRRGLESNALALVPEGEARLAQVHRRHRARTVALTVAALAIASVGTAGVQLGLGATGLPEPAQQSVQDPNASEAPSDARIPDSGWRKVVTRRQLVRAGADRQFLADNVRDSGRLPTILSFVGTVYSQTGRYPAAWTVGDAGTVSYDSNGRLVLTSTAPDCNGCVATLDWQVTGDRLTLSGFRGDPPDPITEVMLEGVWTRVES